MKKNIFFSKRNSTIYYIIAIIIIPLLILSVFSFYNIKNQKYFIISNSSTNLYFIIPNDKEGEKVRFTDKKGINNLLSSFSKNNKLHEIDDIAYTIQLFSDIKYKNVEEYSKNLQDHRSSIISSEDLFLFSVKTQIGTDYFLTYKNFNSKLAAIEYCKKLSFVKKCIIINPKSY